jgi:hypothetical protein
MSVHSLPIGFRSTRGPNRGSSDGMSYDIVMEIMEIAKQDCAVLVLLGYLVWIILSFVFAYVLCACKVCGSGGRDRP